MILSTRCWAVRGPAAHCALCAFGVLVRIFLTTSCHTGTREKGSSGAITRWGTWLASTAQLGTQRADGAQKAM